MALGQFFDARSRGRGHLVHPLIFVHDRADQDRFVVHHLHDEDLIVMAIVGRDTCEPERLCACVPLV